MTDKIILIERGEIISNDQMIAECFNDHFVNITESLGLDPTFRDDLECQDLEIKIDRATEKYKEHASIIAIKNRKCTSTFSFEHVNPWNVMDQIKALDTNKSSSGDIPTKIIDEAKDVLCPYLTDCINTAINNCCFPEILKESYVTPIHKNKDTTQKVNYRPISVLQSIAKVFERIKFDQMYQYFANILSPLLSGFRKGYSTQHALVRVIESWKKCLDSSGIVGTILMDLSKAYDCIPYDLLIAKLSAYGFQRNALKLIYSYLTNRSQRVKVRSKNSTAQRISIGVPQGSVLGPLLFNIFINNIFLMDLESEICSFADDTTLYSCSTSLDDATIRLENDLKKLLTWFTENGMRANPSKFQMMFLGHKRANKLCLNVNGQFILQNEEVKLLGVKIDRKLTFETHVKEICTKVNQKVSAFRRVRPYLGI